MPRVSSGLLMYRLQDGKLQVLLAHPGGPFFKNKDEGASTPRLRVVSGEVLAILGTMCDSSFDGVCVLELGIGTFAKS